VGARSGLVEYFIAEEQRLGAAFRAGYASGGERQLAACLVVVAAAAGASTGQARRGAR
jgi:hypothetical protein